MGLDTLEVRSGAERAEGASVVLGKYLSPRFYVSYVAGLQPAADVFRVRYELARHWLLQAESSTRGSRNPGAHAVAEVRALEQFRALAPRPPFALVATECLGRLLPQEYVVALLGSQAGLGGTLFAALAGGFLPGGPMVAFPLAIALFRAGAGQVALITAWSLLAVNRTLLFEVPLMGARFALSRIAVSAPSPILAGLMAAGVLSAF